MPNELEQREITRQIAFRITGVFEAPGYSTVQTVDSGIISYGQHQATLVSGTLETVLRRYIEFSDSEISKKIEPFINRVAARDVTLKNNDAFLDLLKKAGAESEMRTAQDSVFVEKYWNPAIQKAIDLNLKSPLAFACFYDTGVQGGLNDCIERTKNKLGNSISDEQKYLKTFLQCRQERLLELAQAQIESGNPRKMKNGQMLKNAARNRVGSLLKLAEAGNLDLVGEMDINGHKVKGRAGEQPAGSILERGNEGEAVGVLQDKLTRLGYLTAREIGPNRGKFGPLTENAVENFQADLGLIKTGKFTEADQKILTAVLKGIGKGVNPSEAVTKIYQKRLVTLGLMTQAQVDTGFGVFGPKTAAAVRRFQKARGSADTGIVDAHTFRLLFSRDTGPPEDAGGEVFAAADGEHYIVLKDVLMTKELEKKVAELAKTYFGLTNAKLTVTSGYRPPFRQAPAIYKNIVLKGVNTVRNTYKNKKLIDEILDAFQANKNNESKAITAMQKVIEDQVKRREFISNHLLGNAIDLRVSTTVKSKIQKSLEIVGGRLVDEGDHYHIELR
jgi:peptidoglycan hydrolase-like protein with peptidoglycan-binding domain